MSEVFIHKPLGTTIDKDLRASLEKKYGLGYMLYCTNQNKSWVAPIKTISKVEMGNDILPYSADCESVIYFNTSTVGAYQRKNFFFEKEEGSWHVYLPSFEIKSINDGGSNSCKFPYNHTEDSTASVLYDRFLKPLKNSRKIELMRFFLKKDGTESAWICNGAVHLLTNNRYDVNGVSFSNLDHENDLSFDVVKTISISLALLGFQKDPTLKPKDLIEKISKSPHREIKQQMQANGLEEFWKQLA